MDKFTFPLHASRFVARIDGKPTVFIQTADHAIRIAPLDASAEEFLAKFEALQLHSES